MIRCFLNDALCLYKIGSIFRPKSCPCYRTNISIKIDRIVNWSFLFLYFALPPFSYIVRLITPLFFRKLLENFWKITFPGKTKNFLKNFPKFFCLSPRTPQKYTVISYEEMVPFYIVPPQKKSLLYSLFWRNSQIDLKRCESLLQRKTKRILQRSTL